MKFLAGTTPSIIVQGSEAEPYDLLIQNISANDVYVDLGGSPSGHGIKLISGSEYHNDYVTNPVYVYSAVADSELRVLAQKAIKKVVACYGSRY